MRRTTIPRTLAALALATLLVGLAAFPALAQEVALDDDGFSPSSIEVEVGESIVWVNRTDDVQTVVGEDGTWDSGPLRPGETFSVAFRDAGTFRYAAAEGEVVGTVLVVEAQQTEEVAEEVDDEEEATAEVALPNTGGRALTLLGWSLVLVGAGALCVQRAGRATS